MLIVRKSPTRPKAGTTPTVQRSRFPLSIDSSGRFLKGSDGLPFLLHGDTPWSMAAQLTNAEITSYLNDRASKGFTAIMFNAIEHYFTSQSPLYRNVDGVDPFSSMTDFASSMNSGYWNRVDHIVNSAYALGIACVINPAYFGYGGGQEGWYTDVQAESDADLQTYGAALGTRYSQGNVIWCLGGDYDGVNSGNRTKQAQIIVGIRTVRTSDLVTAHPSPGTDGYANWSGVTGFNLNFAYPGADDVYASCATSYGRSGPTPFFMGEAVYEQERSTPITAAGLRRQSYQALLSGACGQFFGNNPIWHFESPNTLYSYSGTWESNLGSTGSTHQQHVKSLFTGFQWQKLVPKTDTSLVSSSLSSGVSRICPALASDGTFAMIWVPESTNVTIVTNALTGVSGQVRVRKYDTTAGTFSTVGNYTKGTGEVIASGGETVLVVDAAP
jgi:hypothetical protein